MAVLLPVVLLAGLARKLFAPLALTVGGGDDRLVLRQHGGHAGRVPLLPRARGARPARARPSRRFIDRLAERLLARRCATCCRTARTIVGAALVARRSRAGWAASRLPSTFFPEIDESMDMIYVRFAPGISVQDAAETDDRDGASALGASCPKGTVEMVVANIGMPQNARSLLVSPNVAPNTGYLRLAFSDPEERKLSQGEIAAKAREILTPRVPRASRCCSTPGGLVASVFANGYTAPLVVEVRDDNLAELDEQAQGRRRRRADDSRHPRRARVAADRLPRDPRRHRPREGGLRGVHRPRARPRRRSTRRSATSTRRASGSTRTTASRTTSSPSTTARSVADTQALGGAAGARQHDRQARPPRRLRQHPPQRRRRSRSSATTWSASRTC